MRPVPVYRRILHFPRFSFAACFPGHPFSTDPAAPRSRASPSLTLWPCTPQPLSIARALSYQVPLRVTIFVYLASLSLWGVVLSAFPPSPLLPSPLFQGFSGSLPRFLHPMACGGCRDQQGALFWHLLSFVCFLYLQITKHHDQQSPTLACFKSSPGDSNKQPGWTTACSITMCF